MSVSTYSLVHPFQKIFEVVEPALPERCHLPGPVDQGTECRELCAVVSLASFVATANEARLLQHRQMLRDDGLRDTGMHGEVADSGFTFAAQALEDRSPRGVGERLE